MSNFLYIVAIKKEEVRYLVFEGGGGKGATYLGALKALEELDVIKHVKKTINGKKITRLDTTRTRIKGIAGTSVGSLTAVLIASGYTSEEIEKILLTNLTDQFLDTVEFGVLPTIYTNEHKDTIIRNYKKEEKLTTHEKNWEDFLREERNRFASLWKLPLKAIKDIPYHVFTLLFRWYLYRESKREDKKREEELTFFPTITDLVHSKTLKNAVDKILNDTKNSLNSLKYEFGFFLGKTLRDAVDKLIEAKCGIKNCTFHQFQKEFGVDLVVVSYDMYNKSLSYFRNNKHWQHLCVADAVRMSVSIPFVFKPVFANMESGKLTSFNGNKETLRYFVDGGVANNFPLHVFDNHNTRQLNRHTIGFILSYKKRINPFAEEVTLLEYLEDVFMAILKQTTNLQIRGKNEMEQVIELDPGNIKVLDFSFDKLPTEVINKAKEEVLTYFTKT